MKIFYSPEYVIAENSIDTTRKAGWVAESLLELPIPGISIEAPDPLTRMQVQRVHSPDYVRAIETGAPRGLAESQGFAWSTALLPMVLSSNGGVVAAAHAALQDGAAGSLSSGLHHASYESGKGFCTFNGLAIAAASVLDAGAVSVLVLDLDAHCGGGTASLIALDRRIRQVDVSVSRVDYYNSCEQARLEMVDSAADYLPTVQRVLGDLDDQRHRFDLCLYNAGMDPHDGCDIGGLSGITDQILGARERIVFEWCRDRRLPVAFVLAGGYVGPRLDRAHLVRLHRLTLLAAVGDGSGSPRAG